MTTFKPHALARPHADQISLRVRDKVRALVDLTSPDDGTVVPAGTEGKVILANGFNWLRYRVLFPGGVEIGDLDSRTIEPIGRAAKRLAKSDDAN